MRRYSDGDENNIRLERQIREWKRSGFLTKDQDVRLLSEVRVDLKRTNIFLRAVLFFFGTLIASAAVALIGVTMGFRNDTNVGLLCLLSGVGCFAAADAMVGGFKLYRFGIEEALASLSAILISVGIGISSGLGSTSHSASLSLGLAAGVIVAFAVYMRFGYVYAALGSVVCLVGYSYQVISAWWMQMLAASLLLFVVFVAAHLFRRGAGDHYRGDDYGIIEAAAFAGAYVVLNIHLRPGQSDVFAAYLRQQLPPWFYWFTYVMTWLLPAVGFLVSLRDKQRPLILVSLGLALVTLTTNKPYLGQERQVWDPILFGLVLIGAAIVVKRWLSSGPNAYRHGYTASRLLKIDGHILTAAALASAAIHPVQPPSSPTDRLDPGGGRSGGAGASGEF